MCKLINGIHHTALRPTKENYEHTVNFYTTVLGFTVQKEWVNRVGDEEIKCSMIDTGDGSQIEIFGNGKSDELNIGAIPHVCYATEDVPAVMETVAKAGYPPVDAKGVPVEKSYNDIVLCENPYFALRVGFIVGPCGELIEFTTELPCHNTEQHNTADRKDEVSV